MRYNEKKKCWEVKLRFYKNTDIDYIFPSFFQKINERYSNSKITRRNQDIYLDNELIISFSYPYIVSHGRKNPQKRIKILCYDPIYLGFIKFCFKNFIKDKKNEEENSMEQR